MGEKLKFLVLEKDLKEPISVCCQRYLDSVSAIGSFESAGENCNKAGKILNENEIYFAAVDADSCLTVYVAKSDFEKVKEIAKSSDFKEWARSMENQKPN